MERALGGDIGTETSRAPQRSRQAPVRRPTPSKRPSRWLRGRVHRRQAEAAFPTPPVGSPSTRFIADTRAVAAHQSIKGWITIDGTDGFLPAALVYADGDEVLRIRFQGEWL